MRINNYILVLALFAVLLCVTGCKKKTVDTEPDSEILVAVGDSSLTVADVVRRIPVGLTEEDSVNLFNRIVEEWVQNLVLADYAEKNIGDMDRIDRMVEAYRNNLIVNNYLQSMSKSAQKEISQDRIKRFYDASHELMMLEQPIVKGIFLKVASTDESLPNLRRWLASLKDADLDNIEKSGLRRALQYKYFKDEWVEWDAIAEQIPYRFFDADAFLKSTSNFETEDNGSVYLLRITEFVPSGEEMPYEFAKYKIAEILRQTDMATYRKKLIRDIYNSQIKAGVLKPGTYKLI